MYTVYQTKYQTNNSKNGSGDHLDLDFEANLQITTTSTSEMLLRSQEAVKMDGFNGRLVGLPGN